MKMTERKLRIPEELSVRLDAAAQATELSKNREMWRRLEKSLDDEKLGAFVFSDPWTFQLVNEFARLLHVVGALEGQPWFDDRRVLLKALGVFQRFWEVGPEAVRGNPPDRPRDHKDFMSFTMLDVMLEVALRHRASSQEEQEPPEEPRGFE